MSNARHAAWLGMAGTGDAGLGAADGVSLSRVKTINSHAGLARFMAELSEEPIGEIPRQVHTPYAYSPAHVVWDWHGTPVIIAETRHKHYEIFRVDGPIGPVEQ